MEKDLVRETGVVEAATVSIPVPARVFRPVGCLECRNTGFLGRTGIYEMMPLGPRLRSLIGAQLDASEVDEIVALIDFVAVCRTYAGELAINEVTLRTFSDLQHYVEQSTEALVQSLRASEGKNRAYRQLQAGAAIRFCNVLFGPDYASLMGRAAENAMTGERKSSRAG